MHRFTILAATIALAACGSSRPLSLSAPAPADALSCALGTAVEVAYDPVEGGVSDGFIRLARNRSLTLGDAGREAAARIASFGLMGNSRVEYDVLRVVDAGGTLRVDAWGIENDGDQAEPTEDAEADAHAIIERCGG